MNWIIIEQILKRYWEGNTSIEEEKQLKDAFMRDDVPGHLSPFIGYFNFAAKHKSIEFPKINFEAEFLQKISSKKTFILLPKKVFAYAAGLLLLLSSLFFLLRNDYSKAKTYKPLTTKEMQVAKKYMAFMSKNIEKSMTFSSQNMDKFNLLNKGSETIQYFEIDYHKQIKMLNQVDYIDQSFKRLKYLKSIEKKQN